MIIVLIILYVLLANRILEILTEGLKKWKSLIVHRKEELYEVD